MQASAAEIQFVPPYGIGASVLAAGSKTVWAYVPGPGYAIYEYNPGTQSFQYKFAFEPVKSMSTGGGSAVQNDEDWLLDYSGYLWRFDVPTQTLQLIQGDNRMQSVVVGPGYSDSCHPYEVWVTLLDEKQGRFADRYNFCTKTFSSPGSSASTTGPSQIATGGGEVWALNPLNQVFRYNPSTNAFTQMPGSLTQLAVGVNGVWGIDGAGQFYEFNPATQTFDMIDSTIVGPMESVAAAGDGVWVLTRGQGALIRYEPGNRKFSGWYAWDHQNNTLVVGTGVGVWNTDVSGNILTYVTP